MILLLSGVVVLWVVYLVFIVRPVVTKVVDRSNELSLAWRIWCGSDLFDVTIGGDVGSRSLGHFGMRELFKGKEWVLCKGDE